MLLLYVFVLSCKAMPYTWEMIIPKAKILYYLTFYVIISSHRIIFPIIVFVSYKATNTEPYNFKSNYILVLFWYLNVQLIFHFFTLLCYILCCAYLTDDKYKIYFTVNKILNKFVILRMHKFILLAHAYMHAYDFVELDIICDMIAFLYLFFSFSLSFFSSSSFDSFNRSLLLNSVCSVDSILKYGTITYGYNLH